MQTEQADTYLICMSWCLVAFNTCNKKNNKNQFAITFMYDTNLDLNHEIKCVTWSTEKCDIWYVVTLLRNNYGIRFLRSSDTSRCLPSVAFKVNFIWRKAWESISLSCMLRRTKIYEYVPTLLATLIVHQI